MAAGNKKARDVRANPAYFIASNLPFDLRQGRLQSGAACRVRGPLRKDVLSLQIQRLSLARSRSVRAFSARRLASSLTKPLPGATSGCCKAVAIRSSMYISPADLLA